jgi:hypothetical protein
MGEAIGSPAVDGPVSLIPSSRVFMASGRRFGRNTNRAQADFQNPLRPRIA